MPSSDSTSRTIPAPDARQFLSLLRHTADIVLVLRADMTVVDMIESSGQTSDFPRAWIGQRFTDLLGPESLSKCESLFASDVSIEGVQARWRHLNLTDGAGGSLPLLLKFAGLRGGDSTGGLLLGRDLRPTVELQNRFRISHQELESRLDAAPAPVKPAVGSGRAAATHLAGGAIVTDMMAKLGHRPLNGIVQETSRILERLCVTEALGRAHGNRDDAARMLGISVEDLHLSLMN